MAKQPADHTTDTPESPDTAATATIAPEVAEAYDKAPPYAWYGLSVLVLVYVLNFIDRNILGILAEDIKADLGLADSQMGFLYGTAFAVFYALFGIPLGKLADSWHRLRLISMGLAIWSSFTALSGFARNFATLGIARIGVGIGEATASPAAYSLISDWFPKKMRATALAIYSSGIFIGGGFSLFIGGRISKWWNAAYVDGGAPFDLVGWQAAFLMVGLPGLMLAIWVMTLKEPQRGQADGIITPPSPHPFRGFFAELLAVIPPLTLIGAARQGTKPLLYNILGAIVIAALAFVMTQLTGDHVQWIILGIGYYAIYSWAFQLKLNDPPSFKLIWGNPAFLCIILGYGMVSFASYAVSLWNAPYALRILGEEQDIAGLWIGGPGALGGFLGITMGGRIADWLKTKHGAGRILVVMFGLIAPAPALIIAFTTMDPTTFYIFNFIASICSSAALGAAAATSQDLVLPRMRGMATAVFFLSTTMIGLALGPYMAGRVSDHYGDLSTGVLSVLLTIPIGIVLLITAWKLVPIAEETVVEKARAAGEKI